MASATPCRVGEKEASLPPPLAQARPARGDGPGDRSRPGGARHRRVLGRGEGGVPDCDRDDGRGDCADPLQGTWGGEVSARFHPLVALGARLHRCGPPNHDVAAVASYTLHALHLGLRRGRGGEPRAVRPGREQRHWRGRTRLRFCRSLAFLFSSRSSRRRFCSGVSCWYSSSSARSFSALRFRSRSWRSSCCARCSRSMTSLRSCWPAFLPWGTGGGGRVRPAGDQWDAKRRGAWGEEQRGAHCRGKLDVGGRVVDHPERHAHEGEEGLHVGGRRNAKLEAKRPAPHVESAAATRGQGKEREGGTASQHRRQREGG